MKYVWINDRLFGAVAKLLDSMSRVVGSLPNGETYSHEKQIIVTDLGILRVFKYLLVIRSHNTRYYTYLKIAGQRKK